MAAEFTMPKLGLTMEEGTIVEWLVPDGAEVDDGQTVMVIQTDKVETEVNCVGGGILHQVAGVGDTRACGDVVALLLQAGEEPPTAATAGDKAPPEAPAVGAPIATASAPVAPVAPPSDGRRFVSPNARRVAGELGVDLATVRGTGPGGRIVSEDVEAAAAAPPAAGAPAHTVTAARPAGPFVAATFAARSLADLLGIDITTVATEARDLRVTRDDVARHVRSLLAERHGDTAAPAAAPLPATQTPTSVVPMRGMRGTIAKRMHESLREMAQLTLTMDADMDAVVADRTARKESGPAPSFTDYVIAAVAKALQEHPNVNAQITPDGVALLPEVHVGMAVALDGGLVVPVVRHTDRLSLEELAPETTRLATAARDGKLTLDELEGGTFSVSTLGMYGVDAFTPVINPPNVAILGVGRLRDELILGDDGVTTTTRMTLSLTWDHRAFDGAPAAEFTKSVVTHLAKP